MDPSLPQNDPNPQDRQKKLSKAAEAYQYNRKQMGMLFVDSLPRGEHHDVPYAEAMMKIGAQLIDNRAHQGTSTWPQSTNRIIEDLSKLGPVKAVEQLGEHLVATAGKLPKARPSQVSGYADLIATLRQPLSLGLVDNDAFFAWQQVAGATPITIQSIERLPENFPVTAAHFARAVPGDSLDAALAEGRLFLSDYKVWDGMPTGQTDGFQKYLWAPLALFVQTPQGLRPVAIQVGQRPGADNPIWTPADGIAWKMAKTAVQTADMNVNGVIAHFGYCHEVAEVLICVSHRQLSERHPLLMLLVPHFHYTLAVNAQAQTSLLGPGGAQDRLQSGTLDANFNITNQALAALDYSRIGARDEVAARGVDFNSKLLEYPLRDDGVPLADAIHEWVGAYLKLYYDDASVRADTELAAWVAELSGPGKLNGIPKIDSLASLVKFVGDMIWRITGFHSVINYAGWDYASWTPGQPSAAFGPGPVAGTGNTDAQWTQMLGPLTVSGQMMELMYVLGTLQLNTLGGYPADAFSDPRVAAPLAQLQAKLKQIDTDTRARNAKRPWTVPFLFPANVANSIHV